MYFLFSVKQIEVELMLSLPVYTEDYCLPLRGRVFAARFENFSLYSRILQLVNKMSASPSLNIEINCSSMLMNIIFRICSMICENLMVITSLLQIYFLHTAHFPCSVLVNYCR